MNLATATVTVYFIGLVNFYAESGKREVIVPMTPRDTEYEEGVKLVPHRADIVIKEWSGAATTDCTVKLRGTPSGGTPATTCTVTNVKGKIITLPVPSVPTLSSSANFDKVLKLPDGCSALPELDRSYLTDKEKYAIRTTLTKGALHSCLNGSSWYSHITLAGTNGNFTIGDSDGSVTVTLDDKTVVEIRHEPHSGETGTERQHFGWHYLMYKIPASCAIDPPTPEPVTCEATLEARGHRHIFPFASGIGCSNTQYP